MSENNYCKDCCKETEELFNGYCKSCFSERKEESTLKYSPNATKEEEKERIKKIEEQSKTTGCIITAILLVVIIGIIFNPFKNKDSTRSTNSKNDIPTNTEIVSYAQTVLSKEVPLAKYSYGTSEYNVIGTDFRYKIEGTVTLNNSSEKFTIIIEFTDETYTEYDLKSLQIGDNKIY